MATIQEVNSSIMFGNFTNEQLDSIISAVKFARNSIAKSNKRQFTVGANVKFTNSRTGRDMHGKVVKVAIKYITVDCGVDRTWRVPANMLTAWERA